jgi:glutaconate CoA-transferase subunit A
MGPEDKLMDRASAVAMVSDGDTVYLGGAVLDRKPVALVQAIIVADRKDLRVVTFAGSIDVDLLVGADAIRSVAAAYVGLGPIGPAPRFVAGVKAGHVDDLEYSEWTLLGRLRAAAMGLPFIPTRAGTGSDVLAIHDFEFIEDPYTGDSYIALAPLRPDVTLLHAWRASPSGHVQMAWPPQHLWDVDVVAARAAHCVVVSVDEVVPESVIAADPQHTRLFAFEVDAIVEIPGGAWPTSSPPRYEEDLSILTEYSASGGDPWTLETAAIT